MKVTYATVHTQYPSHLRKAACAFPHGSGGEHLNQGRPRRELRPSLEAGRQSHPPSYPQNCDGRNSGM